MHDVQFMIMGKMELYATERNFYENVRRSITANPFSDERIVADSRLINTKAVPGDRKKLYRLIQAVEEMLQRTCKGVEKPILCFQSEDKELVQYGFLFIFFHKYCDHFDQHIQEQISSGDAPCRVRFADNALSEMHSIGLSRKEAVRFFALFFQMRRAFYFINQMVGSSSSMRKLRRNLWNNVFTEDIWVYNQFLWNRMEDFSTLLLGPTGTGKGLATSAIGRSGFIPYDEKRGCFTESFTKVFISINLSQYPEQLVESELFGHKKGAFTGAIDGHKGIFSLCSPAGAIFLDEIGEVSIPVQIKLLQVLQERNFSPVGSHKKERFYGRVIAATNRSIEGLRKQKVFRDDFYYRLCSDIIVVPSLFQRIQEDPQELEALLAHTVSKIIGRNLPALASNISKTLKHQLPLNYPWPGNVRELEQSVRRILLKQEYKGDRILLESTGSETLDELFLKSDLTASRLLRKYCKVLYEKLGTYEAVARRVELDRRTVKKYIESKEKSGN